MNLSRNEKFELLKLLEEKERRRRYNKLKEYKPYPKQLKFHNDQHRERLLMAGNQLGKTYCAAMEVAYHATGLYPDWWEGITFDRAPIIWVAGLTGEVIRDTSQKLILGRLDADELGEGSIPKDLIEGFARAIGVKNAVDHIKVKHKTGRTALIYFKSYSSGREKFQGETVDFAWCDEEPPSDVYAEMITRTSRGQHGIRMMMTFTPLLGRTQIVNEYLSGDSKQKCVINYTLDDVDHYSQEEKEAMIASWPEHERDARARGIPILGSGRIFQFNEDLIKEDPMDDDRIPAHWYFINGIDFGFDHPTAAVQIAYDMDKDIVHVHRALRVSLKESGCSLADIALRVRHWGEDVPTAWPHDGLQHDKGSSNEQLKTQYENAGLFMLYDKATHEAGGNGVEAGILEMNERMRSGRLRVSADLEEWFEEFRLYHRKDGKIVKLKDDLLCATRYAIMMLRFAEQRQDKVRARYGSSQNHFYGGDNTDSLGY